MRFVAGGTRPEQAALAAALDGRRPPRHGDDPPVRLDRLRALDVAGWDRWLVGRYGPGPFPAVVVGSGGGAVVYLAAALGVPYLPQSTLAAVPLGRIRDPALAEAALVPLVDQVARGNPGIAVHVLPDPAGEPVARFWLKRQRLSPAYARLLAGRLRPGGTILQVECTGWAPARAIGDRGWFQPAEQPVPPAGATEVLQDQPVRWAPRPAVSAGAADQPGEQPPRRRIPPGDPRQGRRPEPGVPAEGRARDGSGAPRPVAAWGWDPALGTEISRLADRYGHRLVRITWSRPGELSGFVADLHRWWYRELGRRDDQLLVAPAVPADLRWPHRAGLVPYWLPSAAEDAYQELNAYLEASRPYDVIYVHPAGGGRSPLRRAAGEVPARRWWELLERHALRRGAVVGERGATVPGGYPAPEPLTVEQVGHFLRHAGGRYPLTMHQPG